MALMLALIWSYVGDIVTVVGGGPRTRSQPCSPSRGSVMRA